MRRTYDRLGHAQLRIVAGTEALHPAEVHF
jgi:hypothetical protein